MTGNVAATNLESTSSGSGSDSIYKKAKGNPKDPWLIRNSSPTFMTPVGSMVSLAK
jgi:hypothetical protein